MDGERAISWRALWGVLVLALVVSLSPSAAVNGDESDEQQNAEADVLGTISRALSDAVAGDSEQEADPPERTLEATHEQIELIQIPSAGDSGQARKVKAFCLDDEGNLLAAVHAESGEIVVISPAGEQLRTLPLPVHPEAINVGPDGQILVGGGGQVLILNSEGEIRLQRQAPQVAAMLENKNEMRKQVVEQMRSSKERMKQQIKSMHDGLSRVVESAATPQTRAELRILQKQIETLSAIDKRDRSKTQKKGLRLRERLVTLLREDIEQNLDEAKRQQRDRYQQQIATYEKYLERYRETDEDIQKMLDQTIQYKSRLSSIGAAGGDVFIATGALKGYGYDVWRLDQQLENPEKIVTGLRGCCGQMDVQANEKGVFVAENARHRVCRFDRTGEQIHTWGKRARSGVEGFGGCCNPMNVAFGADGSVYTAESSTGRIKHYSTEGELLELIGSVELVPGCKNVSIAVSHDGDRLYMLDITRNHIVVMGRKSPTEDALVAGAGE